MGVGVGLSLLSFATIAIPLSAKASGLTPTQISGIIGLL